MPAADLTTGFFGKIPATGDFVSWNLPRKFIDRWDRWMSMELAARPDEGELDPRIWRFVVCAGIFGDQTCAGAWRMSQDRVGRRYPFAIIRFGSPPEPGDPWFEEISTCLEACVEDYWSTAKVMEMLADIKPRTSTGDDASIAFWCDDFDVTEFRFIDIHDLADNGLPRLRTAKPVIEEI